MTCCEGKIVIKVIDRCSHYYISDNLHYAHGYQCRMYVSLDLIRVIGLGLLDHLFIS